MTIVFGWGELFALSSAICWATAVILYKAAGESLTAHSLNLAKNLVGILFLVPTAFFVHGFDWPSLSGWHWAILIASGYFGIAVADTWYLQALRTLGAGRTAIIASLYSPFVVLLAIIFLGERLVGWQWFGFVLVLLGILTVVYQRHYSELDRATLTKGLTFASASVFLTAAGVVAMKPILAADGFFWIVALRLLAGTAGMVLLLMVRGRLSHFVSEVQDGEHRWPTIVTAGFIGTYLALIFWLAGFKYADASVASVLNETANVFIVIMAFVFLGEALSRRRMAGIALTFSGVLIFLGVFTG